MLKRKLLVFLLLVLTIGTTYAEEKIEYPSTIFAQTDSYMAVKKGEEYPFSFFFIYSTTEALDDRQIERLYLQDADSVECLNTKLQTADPCGQYQAMSLMTNFHFHEEGSYLIENITIAFSDGSKKMFPIGRLMIEVFSDEGNENLYTYETTALSSQSNAYTWRCYRKNEAVMLDNISIDTLADYEVIRNRQMVETNAAHGYELGNEITIAFAAELPAVYRFILPKVEVVENGVKSIAYAKVGCYCGGLGITEESVLKAYEAFQMNN